MTTVLRNDPHPPTKALPGVLHLGSGKNFQADWLNVDIEPRWRPDVLLDLAQPLPTSCSLPVSTDRFGKIELTAEMFDEAVAQDVLEHIPGLTQAMTNVLHLLKTGGVFKISVPYELSLGAWCDPTHVRAFNERSWVYYCQWSWYLGWRTHNFQMQRLDFVPSDYGQELVRAGRTQEEIVRTPRAIDSMYVELVKKPLTAEEQLVVTQYLDSPRAPARQP